MLTYRTSVGERTIRVDRLHIAGLKIALCEMVRIKGEDVRFGMRQDMNDKEIEEISKVLFDFTQIQDAHELSEFTFTRLTLSYNCMSVVYPELHLMTRSLDVSHNRIEDAFNLENNTILQSLYLQGNRLTSDHFTSILESVEGNSTLKYLNLADNRINLNACWKPVHFELNSITTLSLARNTSSLLQATSNVIVDILKSTTSLTTLDISSCHITEQNMDEILDAASKSVSLTSLDVSHNDIGIESLTAFIRHNDTLKELSAFTVPSFLDRDQLLGALSVNTTLTSIDIYSHEDPTIRRAIRSTEWRNMSLYELLFAVLYSHIHSISFKRQRE